METIRICPQCQTPLPGAATEGLCPACLARVALGSTTAGEPRAKAGRADSTATIALGPEALASVRYFGDYELLTEIARGGMGVVWKARQVSLNRTVAVKMILSGKFAGASEMQRFRREAEAAANLQHPNIVAIHEVGEHDGQHYYSMDYIAGRDLGAVVREDGPLSPARAAECLQTIAEAVHFAHQRGTLHRDLKPQNVLMDAAGIPRITDFGLAKLTERDDGLTASGAAMGSPSYMPPEQAAGQTDRVGPASDVYALGAILYELLTGRPPFRAETPMATMREVMEGHAVAPRKLNPAVPPDLQNICLKCLEKNPVHRYHSARALAEDLQRFRQHEPIQAHPVSAFRQAESWLRRHPWTLIAAGSLAFMVLAGLLYWQYEQVKCLEFRHLHTGAPPRLPGELGNDTAWFRAMLGMYLLTVFAQRIFRKLARGARDWWNIFDRSTDWAPAVPVSEPVRVVFGLIVVAGLALEMLYAGKLIQEFVWENAQPGPAWLVVYAGFSLSLYLLAELVRDYQKFVHGTPARTLPAGQHEMLHEAVFEGDLRGAATLYRRALPEASRDEAKDFVARLAADLRTKQPDKFVPPPRWWELNWRTMRLCLLLELCSLVVAWHWLPVASPARRVFCLAAGFSLGACLVLTGRQKNFWKRVLFLIAFCALTTVGLQRIQPTNIYLLGQALGMLAIMAGFKRQSGKAACGTIPSPN